MLLLPTGWTQVETNIARLRTSWQECWSQGIPSLHCW